MRGCPGVGEAEGGVRGGVRVCVLLHYSLLILLFALLIAPEDVRKEKD